MSTQGTLNGEPRLSNRRLLTIIALGSVVMLAIILIITESQTLHDQNGLVIPDETAVAVERLAKSFTGPRYFQATAGERLDASGAPSSAPVVSHISATAARRQIDRIAAERQLSPAAKAQAEKLIGRLTESPRSRVIGEDHINLVRLNLALDELK